MRDDERCGRSKELNRPELIGQRVRVRCYILITTQRRRKTSEDFFIKIFTSHFIVRVRKGYSRFACERELETEQNCNILTPTLMAVNVVSFSFSKAAQPEDQGPSSLLGDGFLYCILSATSLDLNSIGGPEGPFGLVWLFLPHLVSYSSGVSVYECTMGILRCPILLAKSTYAISLHNCHRNVSLPSGASL